MIFIIFFCMNIFAAMEFLNLDTSARITGLGGAYVALSDDISCIGGNPAGLGKFWQNQVSFMYNRHFLDVVQGFVGYGNKDGFAIGLNYLDYGYFERSTLSNPTGEGLGGFSIKDYAIIIACGKEFYYHPGLFLGGSLKFVKEEIDNVFATALAFDIGINYEVKFQKFMLGFAIQNFGGKTVSYKKYEEELPFNIKAGLFWQFIKNSFLLFDINFTKDSNIIPNFGIEYTPVELLDLRIGYNGRASVLNGLSGGIGVNIKGMFIDYGFCGYGQLGTSHRVSITFGF